MSGADVQGDAALLIRASAYGTVGAVGLAGVCIWGVFKMAIWMAKESGRLIRFATIRHDKLHWALDLNIDMMMMMMTVQYVCSLLHP